MSKPNGKPRLTFKKRVLDTYKRPPADVPADDMNRITFKQADQPVSGLDQVLTKVSYYLRNVRHLDNDTVNVYTEYVKSAWNKYKIHDPTYQNALELINILHTIERPPTKNHPEKRIGLAPNTINHYIEALRYWADAIDKPMVDDKGQPAKIKKIHIKNKRVDHFTPEEFMILLNACRTNKQRYIVAGVAYLGTRPLEFCELRKSDWRLKDGYVDVIDHGKGLKTPDAERPIPIVNEFLQFYYPWIEEREHLALEIDHRPFDNNDYVLVNQWYEPYEPDDLYQEIRRIAERTSLRGKAYTYKLRKTFGTNGAYNGVPPNTLMRMMGHSDIRTTLRYYVGNDDKLNAKIMNDKFSYFK
jgi:integrase